MLQQRDVAPSTGAASATRDYAYYKAALAGRRMPCAYLDRDLLDANVRAVVSRAGEKTVRLATKSLRSAAVIRRILAADARFQGLMCFTVPEAVWLASQGFGDLLLGYPCADPADYTDVARATAEGGQITLMVDSLAHVDLAEGAARHHGVRLPLCLDLDMALDVPGLHFGTWRSPLRTPEQARPVIERILASPDLTLDGVMGYEAQIAGVGDAVPGKPLKNALVRRLQARSVREVARRRAAIVALIRALGGNLRVVNGGGTGSMASTGAEAAVTEITVGSAFYAPALFDAYRAFRYAPAAAFAAEIVRRPGPGRYTCLGGGYVASGAAGPDKLPRPCLPKGARLEALEGAGEVQTPVRYTGPVKLEVGDPIFFRHAKAGELCERFDSLLLVSDGKVVDTVTTYRGDGRSFL
jgi:D-serine deaminase-like pyridoxal phosphate-dependent protein